MAVDTQLLFGQPLPLLVYSFSSRGFPDLIDQIRTYVPLISSSYLISLYDYKYLLNGNNRIFVNDHRIRIWDSGGYEIRSSDDISAVKSALPGSQVWNEKLYIDVANTVPWNGSDILVSYDGPADNLTLSDQLDKAFALYERIKGNYLKDVLLHLEYPPDAKEVANALVPFADKINIVGFTEKEVAPTWVDGVIFLHALNTEFSRLGMHDRFLIHIFGCFDPKSIIRFALAGAHIFDGLTWLRFVFHKDSTLYKREFEYLVQPSSLLGADIESSIIAHNIREIERLRSDLGYALATSDFSAYEEICGVLKKLTTGG
ncbi:MAG: hypothetical protein H6672_13160 [Anaerolineaceae bacterium]|nr:hypothetical protein [Anaerolineaceae bacterium]